MCNDECTRSGSGVQGETPVQDNVSYRNKTRVSKRSCDEDTVKADHSEANVLNTQLHTVMCMMLHEEREQQS